MSLDLIVRFAVSLVIGFTLAYCTAWLLSLFLWGWLAALLAFLITIAASCNETVQHVTDRAGDIAVDAAASALGAFRSLRARLAR